MKNDLFKKIFAGFFVFCFCFATVAWAADSQNVFIPAGENYSTDLLRAGETVDVAGNVNGDAMLAGANVSFSGNASGDILLAGGNVRVKGNSGGNVRVAGGTVTLDGTVEKNVTVAGGTVIIDETSVIKGNLYIASGNAEIRGRVLGNTAVYGSQILLSGNIGGDADLRGSTVTIRQDASVGGNLTYASNSEIAPASGVVKGSVNRVQMENYAGNYDGYKKSAERTVDMVSIIWEFLSLLAVGYVLYKIFGKQVNTLVYPIKKDEVWNRIAYGFLAFVLNPIVVFITFITLIGAPLALMILFAYVIFLVSASVLAPVLVGRALDSKLKLYSMENKNLWIDFTFGYFVMEIIKLIPVLGAVALAFVFLFSFGRVNKYVIETIKANR